MQKPKIESPNLEVATSKMELLDIIAPEQAEKDFDYLKLGGTYYRTIFVSGYPRFVSPGWLEPIINFNSSLITSFYIYPVDGKSVLDDLRRKITEMEAEISIDIERGKIINPTTQAKLEDARALQEELVKGAERFFEFAFYITIPAGSVEDLNQLTRQVESTLGSLLAVGKHATLNMEDGFVTSLPFGKDTLSITRNMDTTSLATTFPLTSAELSGDTGVLYGINSQNESFIIFDRFSLENSNMTIFATSGAGKSLEYNSSVLVRINNKVKLKKIGDLVEEEFKKNKIVKLEKEIDGVVSPGIEVFTFNENLKGEWKKVSVLAKKKSPKNLIRVITKSGRETTITKDHCLIALKNGDVKTIRGNEVKTDDFLPVPREIGWQNVQDFKIDIENILIDAGYKEKIKKYGQRLCCRKISRTGNIPKTIKISKKFCELLGYFIAEGSVVPTRAVVTNFNPLIQKRISDYLDLLKIHWGYDKKKGEKTGIYVGQKLFSLFLKEIGVSGTAGEKKVPDLIFNSSKRNVASFVRAYYDGDGGVEKHSINATTKSKELASGITYLLSIFGIIARIKRKKEFYTVVISGQNNIRKFEKEINFNLPEKSNKIVSLISEDNTNVDLVPEIQNNVKNIYNVLFSSSEIKAPKFFSEVKLSMFSPSRKVLSKMVEETNLRIKDIKNIEKDIQILEKLPSLEQIIETGNGKDINRQLILKLNKSWYTMRDGLQPYLTNALIALSITHKINLDKNQVCNLVYTSFRTLGISLRGFDKSLWESVVLKSENKNPSYERIIKATVYLRMNFEKIKSNINKIQKDLNQLELLANSDLFWDPVEKIETIKAEHKFVYDLQVDNEVFLAGHGGLFVHNSFFVKLEAVRSLMLGTEVIVLDPESEYKALCEAVGGQYISFSFNSNSKINPFDLSQVRSEGENTLGLKILTLHSFFKVIMGELDPIKEALLDRAIVMTYRAKGITQDPESQKLEPPLMEDLYKTLIGFETPDALDLASRIEKFVKGSFVGIFDKQTNIDINNPFTVFSIKDLQDALRPIVMFMILDFVWTRVQGNLKRRLLIVEEAWHMMKNEDSAQFMWSVVKRARKYWLGLTTITQDVEDFLSVDIGKAVVTNSALRVLLKQSPAAIDRIAEVFYLSQGEKQLLLAAQVGEGIFFAGPHHAPIRVVASKEEYDLINTNPNEMSTNTTNTTNSQMNTN